MKNRPRATRVYRMTARAQTADQTRQRVLQAALDRFSDQPFDAVSLAQVAQDAGVTVQTVLRVFGSKEGLVRAAAAQGMEQVRAARWVSPPGDLEGAMVALAQHYEAWGDRSMRLLAQEDRVPAVGRVTKAGRALHHQWVDHVFAPWLARARGEARRRLRARLIAVTDVYTWKIFRRDLGLDARATRQGLRELVDAVLA